jgi:hypothetical protein
MSDPATSTIFGAGTGVSYEDLVRRQAIAQALAQQKPSFPKTFGEGLASIGESLGQAFETRYDRRLAREQQAYERDQLAQGPTLPTSTPTPDATTAAPVTPAAAPAPTSDPNVSLPSPDYISAALGADAAPSGPSASADVVPGTDKRQTRADIVQAIADQAPNDEMKGFAQTMAAAEGGATGSGNPYQFMGATARQYNLKDVNDPVAATRAFFQLTDDNRRYLANALGRSPTLPELAQAHQQGAAATARMLLGTGNASPENLAANNVDPKATAGQASTKIQTYYYPNGVPAPSATAAAATAPPSPRATVVATMAGPPPQPAVQATGAPPTVMNIQPAPAPPMAGTIPDPGSRPVARKEILPSPDEQKYQAMADNPYWGAGDRAIAQQRANVFKEQRLAQNKQQADEDKDLLNQWNLQKIAQQQADLSQTRRQQELNIGATTQTTAAQDLQDKIDAAQRLKERGGLSDTEVGKGLTDSQALATKAAAAFQSIQSAKAALLGGIVTGEGAPLKLNWDKFMANMGQKNAGNEAANTEIFRAAMVPVAANLAQQTQNNPVISENDRDFVDGVVGGRISLEPASIKRLLDVQERMSIAAVNQHRDKLNAFYSNNPQAQALYGVPLRIPQPTIDLLRQHPEQIPDFEAKYGKGAAQAVMQGGVW